MIADEDSWLTPDQLSQRWQNIVSVGTLERWRWQKTGPAYTRVGGAVVYSLRNVRAWERRNTINTDGRAPRERALRDLFDNGDFTIDAEPPARLIMLPVRTVAAMLSIGRARVEALIADGQLDEVRLTGRRLITLASAEALARSLRRQHADAAGQRGADGKGKSQVIVLGKNNQRAPVAVRRGGAGKSFAGPSPRSAHRG